MPGPSAQNSSSPILHQPGTPASRSTSTSASRRFGASSAAIRRFPGSKLIARLYHLAIFLAQYNLRPGICELLGDANGVGAALLHNGVDDTGVGSPMSGIEADLSGQADVLGARQTGDEAGAAGATRCGGELGSIKSVGLEEPGGAAESCDEAVDKGLARRLLVVGVIARRQEGALGVPASVAEERAAEILGGGQQQDRPAAADLLGAERAGLGARGVERGGDEGERGGVLGDEQRVPAAAQLADDAGERLGVGLVGH